MNTEEDCIEILNVISKTSTWNPHATFFIYVNVDRSIVARENFVVFILTRLWEYFSVNVTVGIRINDTIPYIKVKLLYSDLLPHSHNIFKLI